MRASRRRSTGQSQRSSLTIDLRRHALEHLAAASAAGRSRRARLRMAVTTVVDEVLTHLPLLVGSIFDSGMIRAACTMAASRPASAHSWRNTLLSTWRAAGLRPNDTLDTPSTVCTPGISALMRRIASIVAHAVAAQVVVARGQREGERVEDEVARTRARSASTARSWMRWAMRIFHSTSRAWPTSSISRQMTAAPCFLAKRHHLVEARARASPSSRLAELSIERPPIHAQRRLEHLGLGRVEHQRRRRLRGEAPTRSRPCRRRRHDLRSRRRRRAGGLPSLIWSRRSARTCPSRSASIASRNAFEPLALVRSPMIRNDVSCSNGTCE